MELDEQKKSCESCGVSGCAAKRRMEGEADEAYLERQAVTRRMCRIRHKVLVLSGKGGVGKSTVAVNLATALAMAGKQVGLLDIDIHGPSVPGLLGLCDQRLVSDGQAIVPVRYAPNLKVVSIGFLLHGREDAVIWRGPMKFAMIKQFLKDVDWGKLDYLVVDSPPGTGDEPLTIAQLIPEADGAVVVTTPQKVAVADVRRCIGFCRQVQLPVLGVIENMSGLICPECGGKVELFKSGGGRQMAHEMDVPFLGSVPIDPLIVEASDDGKPYVRHFPDSPAARAFQEAVAPILALDEAAAEAVERGGAETDAAPPVTEKAPGHVRVAVPLADGRLADHLGRTERFALMDVDGEKRRTVRTFTVAAPAHPPGLWPAWLRERETDVIVANGMGARACRLFEEQGIAVYSGPAGEEPETLAEAYARGELARGSGPVMA